MRIIHLLRIPLVFNKHSEWGILARDKGHPEQKTAGKNSSQTPPKKKKKKNSLEAEGIFIHPANIDFCLCCSFHQCFKLTPHPQPPPPFHALLWHRANNVLGGLIKVAHWSHDVVHLLLTAISSDFRRSTIAFQFFFSPSIKVKYWGKTGFSSCGMHTSSAVYTALYLIIVDFHKYRHIQANRAKRHLWLNKECEKNDWWHAVGICWSNCDFTHSQNPLSAGQTEQCIQV